MPYDPWYVLVLQLLLLSKIFLDDLDSSNFAKALGVMGFEGATKGTFKHGMQKQVFLREMYICFISVQSDS